MMCIGTRKEMRMGLFGGAKNCPICGGKISLMGGVRMADATICSDCMNREFSTDMIVNGFYKDMPISALDGYRAYRAQNAEKLKDFEETDVFFDMIHLDRDTGKYVNYAGALPQGDAFTRANLDVYDLNELLFYDQFYVNATYKEGMLSSKIIADIAMIIATKHPYHPFSLNGIVKDKVKMKAQTGFFGGIKGFDEDPELMQFVSYVAEHMPPAMAEMMDSFSDETLTDIPPQLVAQYDAHFAKLTELKNMGAVDRETYKDYPDNNIASKKLRHVVRKKYGLK